MDKIGIGQALNINDQLVSENGATKLVLQGDGNLVLYRTDNGGRLWASNTMGHGGSRAVLQGDGNFVLYTAGGQAVWANNRAGRGTTLIRVQNDGNVVAYAGGTPVWATNTARSRANLGIEYVYDFDHLPRDPANPDPNESKFPPGDVVTVFAISWPLSAVTNDTPIFVSLDADLGVTWWKGLEVRNWRDEVIDELWTQDAKSSDRSAQHSMAELSGGRLILAAAKVLGEHRPMYELRLPDMLSSLPWIPAPSLNQPINMPHTLAITWNRDDT